MRLRQWHETHENLVTLTAWMADNGYTAENVAHVVEKPWNWTLEFELAKAEQDEDEVAIRRARKALEEAS